MKSKTSAPTMKDVALEAGVALGTVSKVFNNIPVGESYRIRVEEAAQKLGYQVNIYARGLRASRTGCVSLILPNLTGPFFADLAQHTCGILAARGYRTLLAITSANLDMEERCIHMVEQNKVDGIIGLTYNPALEVGRQIPYVSIDRYVNPSVPCVASDNFGGGQMAAEKLISLGCKKLLFFRIGSSVPGEADKRASGFQAVCLYRHVEHHMMILDDEDGYGPFRVFLKEHIIDGKLEYDGIFCNTDKLAHSVLKMLADLGVRVPEDVQLIGYDGVRHFGEGELYCSTIVQPVDKIAETSVSILLEEDRTKTPSLICLPVTYAHGGTTRE